MTPDNAPAPDYTAARDYAARVLAHPDQHGTEAVAAARVLQHLLPAPTLEDLTVPKRAATVGMWATVNPGDDGRPWRGIIVYANSSTARVCNPTALRMGMKPAAVAPDTVTPDPTVPRAWNANGTPARPEPAPDSTLAPGSVWADGAHLENALDQSPYARAVVIDRDNDLAMWTNGYWDGPAYLPGINPGEGPWRIIWIDTDQ